MCIPCQGSVEEKLSDCQLPHVGPEASSWMAPLIDPSPGLTQRACSGQPFPSLHPHALGSSIPPGPQHPGLGCSLMHFIPRQTPWRRGWKLS